MNRSIALLLLLPVLAVAQEEDSTPADQSGILKFTNGDRLSGEPEGIDGEGNLRWQAGFLHQPIPVVPSSILEMRLQGDGGPAEDVGHHARLTLTNGDVLRGQLDALDDEYVTLKTWYGGALKIRRTMAADLEIQRAARTIYSGPEDFESWVIDGERDAWRLNSGALAASKGGSIAREIETPERCRIAFDLAWRSTLRFRVLMFSDDGETAQPENCYDLVCQRRFVYLRKKWVKGHNSGSTIVGQANIAALSEKTKVRFEFYIDRSTGEIALYIDGVQAHIWNDPKPKEGSFGNWLHFVAEEFYPIRISRIHISPWKGDLPENEVAAEETELEDEEGQLIRLQNGDVVVGEVGEIEKGMLDIKTEFCDIKIPVDRMSKIDLSSGEYEEPIRKKGDVRAWLRDGGMITFRLDSFDEDTLKGYSQTFGDAEFKLSAFSRLEFNIYDEELETLRGGAVNW
jgi:hypothetical protein